MNLVPCFQKLYYHWLPLQRLSLPWKHVTWPKSVQNVSLSRNQPARAELWPNFFRGQVWDTSYYVVWQHSSNFDSTMEIGKTWSETADEQSHNRGLISPGWRLSVVDSLGRCCNSVSASFCVSNQLWDLSDASWSIFSLRARKWSRQIEGDQRGNGDLSLSATSKRPEKRS